MTDAKALDDEGVQVGLTNDDQAGSEPQDEAREADATWVEVLEQHFRSRRPAVTDEEVHVLTATLMPYVELVSMPAILLATTRLAQADLITPQRVEQELGRADGTRLPAEIAAGLVLPFRRADRHQSCHDDHVSGPFPDDDWEAVDRLHPTPVERELRQLIVWFDSFRYVETGEFPDWQEHASFREIMRNQLDAMPFEVLAGAARSCAEATFVSPGVVFAECERWYAAHLAESAVSGNHPGGQEPA